MKIGRLTPSRSAYSTRTRWTPRVGAEFPADVRRSAARSEDDAGRRPSRRCALVPVSSRYCDSDKLADFAWSQFGKLSGGTRAVQAVCDFVHAKIRFSYVDARSTLRQRFHG
jgi:hypothetical protein